MRCASPIQRSVAQAGSGAGRHSTCRRSSSGPALQRAGCCRPRAGCRSLFNKLTATSFAYLHCRLLCCTCGNLPPSNRSLSSRSLQQHITLVESSMSLPCISEGQSRPTGSPQPQLLPDTVEQESKALANHSPPVPAVCRSSSTAAHMRTKLHDVPFSIFTPSEKRLIALGAGVCAVFSPVSGQIYYPALNAISEDLHKSHDLINLTITVYLVRSIAPNASRVAFTDSFDRSFPLPDRPGFGTCFRRRIQRQCR